MIPTEYKFNTFKDFYLIRHQWKCWYMTISNQIYKRRIKDYINSRWRLDTFGRKDHYYFKDKVWQYLNNDTTDEEITNIYEYNGGKSWDGGIYI